MILCYQFVPRCICDIYSFTDIMGLIDKVNLDDRESDRLYELCQIYMNFSKVLIFEFCVR